jgi:hypothetical protein
MNNITVKSNCLEQSIASQFSFIVCFIFEVIIERPGLVVGAGIS